MVCHEVGVCLKGPKANCLGSHLFVFGTVFSEGLESSNMCQRSVAEHAALLPLRVAGAQLGA